MALTFTFRSVTEKTGFGTGSVLVVVKNVGLVAVFLRVRLFSPVYLSTNTAPSTSSARFILPEAQSR